MATTGHGAGSDAAALALLASATALYSYGLARLRRFQLGRDDEVRWWFGYARDGVNLGGGFALWVSLVVAGFQAPAALVMAAWLALFTYGVDVFVARLLRLRATPSAVFVVATLVSSCAVLAATSLDERLSPLLASLGPR